MLGYDILFLRLDGTTSVRSVGAAESSLIISNLTPGNYTFNITAVYQEGRGPVDMVTVRVEAMATSDLLREPWFYGVVVGIGVLLLAFIIVLITCICYQLCCRKDKGQATPMTTHPLCCGC